MSGKSADRKRKRILLAGFGTVGEGVFARLKRNPALYDVVGILCRDPQRHAGKGAPQDLFFTDAGERPECDIVAEAIGGVTPADEIILGALAGGVDVATANKTLVARRYDDIRRAANETGAVFRYSAAVGGGVPMLEAVDEAAAKRRIARLDAIVNGTTNFVLERVGDGASLEEAIREAQEAGFAEADPSADIDGRDAAEKLSLLSRRAFGVEIDPDDIACDLLRSLAPEKIRAAMQLGTPYKQVASAERTSEGMRFSVQLRPVEGALAKPRREENVLIITPETGDATIVFGKGAGREPTADSMFSDIEALSLATAQSAFPENAET